MPWVSETYSLPAGTTVSPNTTIQSTWANTLTADLESGMNFTRPIARGGTGSTTAVGAFDNLSTISTDIASSATTDLSTATGIHVTITGTTTITGFGTEQAGAIRYLTFEDALTLTHNATSLILPGEGNITTAAGDVAAFVSLGSGNWRCISYERASGSTVTQQTTRGHIYGLTLSNNTTDATNDIDIAVGEAASDDSTPVLLKLTSGLTKRLDAAWAVGTGNGGLDTGSKANSTWYHVWLIRRSDTGVVDALFSTSATSPTMPTNYDQKRRIGAVRTDGSGVILPFSQFGSDFLWLSSIDDVNVTDQGVAAVSRTLTVPTGVKVFANIRASALRTSVTWIVIISSLDANDEAPSSANAPLGSLYNTPGEADYKEIMVRTNSSGQIRSRSSSTATILRITTVGWVDNRGQDSV